jgi:hypothetical protein
MNYGQGKIYGIASTPARLAVRGLIATPKSFDRPISVRLMNFQPIERANIAGHSKGSGSCIGLIRFVPLLVFFFIDFELGSRSLEAHLSIPARCVAFTRSRRRDTGIELFGRHQAAPFMIRAYRP